MTSPEVETLTKEKLYSATSSNASKALQEMFAGLHPAAADQPLGSVFTPESAAQFLRRVSDFASTLSAADTHADALAKLDALIGSLESVRDEVLAKLFERIRPLERSYRQLAVFFENVDVRDGKTRDPVEFHIFNADTAAMKNDIDSSTILAIDEFVKSRNDTFNFRQFINNLVVPGYVPDVVRKRLEDIANAWGMLLIGDLRDERNYKTLAAQFETDGAYEFLKRPEDKAAADVVVAGYVKLRERHWFEQPEGSNPDADLYAPASMAFAGALARTDRTQHGGIGQGPVGMKFGKLRGVERARIEPRISQMEQLTMERQVVCVVRNADNDLVFTGSRSMAHDPLGVLKFFTSYRILRYIERRISLYLREVAERPLTRELVMKEVRDPIEEMLEAEKKRGTIHHFVFNWDPDEDKLAQGVLDLTLEVLPVGPAETFELKIEVPRKKKGGE